jgi:hypothetical protein
MENGRFGRMEEDEDEDEEEEEGAKGGEMERSGPV